MFRRTGETLSEIELPEDVEQAVYTGSEVPRFQIVRPNICNNFETDCPLGISIYANAIDQLEGLDLVYDSYCNEFRLGKKRITVPVTMARMIMEEDGSATPVFDDNDTEFYAIPAVEGAPEGIKEHNMELRYQAHEAAIQTALNLLSTKCGMGKDRYNFQDGAAKTATEVISEKSDLYQSLKKHELVLEDALVGLVRAIADMIGLSPDLEVTITFDDSIIEDSGTQREMDRQDVRDGLMSKWEYRVKYYGETPEEAKAAVQAMQGAENPFGFMVT